MKKICLLYHRIYSATNDLHKLAVSPERFAEHVAWLDKTCVRLGPDGQVVGDHRRDWAVHITFDDGYADNFTNAMPILERHRWPATFFAVSRADPKRGFWWDELDKFILCERPLPTEFSVRMGKKNFAWRTNLRVIEPDSLRVPWSIVDKATPSPRHALYRQLCDYFKTLAPQEVEHTLDHLAQWSGVSRHSGNEPLLMTAEQLRATATRSGGLFTIGAHTRHHPSISCLERQELEQEVHGSKIDLEAILGKRIEAFAYPYGRREDYPPECIPRLQEWGFARAFVNRPGTYGCHARPYELPRFSIRDWPVAEFERRLRWKVRLDFIYNHT